MNKIEELDEKFNCLLEFEIESENKIDDLNNLVLKKVNTMTEIKENIEDDDLPSEIIQTTRFKISVWKLVLSALIIPMINALSLMFKEYLTTDMWDWAIMLIVINAVTIPAIITWLTSTFNLESQKTKDEYEAEIRKIRAKSASKIVTLKDERDGYKIKSGLSEYALEQASIKKPDYQKYIN